MAVRLLVKLSLLLLSLSFTSSWPTGYEEDEFDSPLVDDVPSYFKGKQDEEPIEVLFGIHVARIWKVQPNQSWSSVKSHFCRISKQPTAISAFHRVTNLYEEFNAWSSATAKRANFGKLANNHTITRRCKNGRNYATANVGIRKKALHIRAAVE